MLFLCYPKCTTCQKARAFLDSRGAAYDLRDIKLENPTADELRGLWKKSGLPLKKFFNTSGLQYKALGLKDKLPEMDEEAQLSLLATDGMLVKRPILAGEDFVLVGFRQAEWRFGGADRIFVPFFSPTHHRVVTQRDFREITRQGAEDLPLVPQVMTRLAPDFLWAAEVLEDMGYTEVNLNLGCPSGTVTAKGKGSGFLAHPEELDAFFNQVFSKVKLPVSVKTRLGYQSPEEFPRLLEIFDRYPIACLTIHARVRPEKYKGPLHLDVFAEALKSSKNPVCFNGDLNTVESVRALEDRIPDLEEAMLGRGAVADPALFRKLRGGPAAAREELQAFTRELYQAYQDFYGQTGTAAQRMREVWFYLIHLFRDPDRLNRPMRRFRTPGEYEAAEAAIFRELELMDHSEGVLA